MSDDAKAEEQKPCHATVMIGHSVDLETNESAVVIYCVGGNRFSVAGARILAAQITQWADHAEKRNADRLKETTMRFMYKAIQQASVKSAEWVPAEPIEFGSEVSSEPAPEKVMAHFALRRKKPAVRKTKKTKRGRK